ncbi:hypothetical protein BX600DRAFT_435482 [Xylariales sp. PMI_506]|nr:hypothetical protein BX600DRAFT_435482 [Xylariales sp. PMI_506]
MNKPGQGKSVTWSDLSPNTTTRITYSKNGPILVPKLEKANLTMMLTPPSTPRMSKADVTTSTSWYLSSLPLSVDAASENSAQTTISQNPKEQKPYSEYGESVGCSSPESNYGDSPDESDFSASRVTQCNHDQSRDDQRTTKKAPRRKSTTSSATSSSRKRRGDTSSTASEAKCSREDEQCHPSKRSKSYEQNTREEALFACPFYKKDTQKHQRCLRYKLKRIKDVKQHIGRQHNHVYYVGSRCNNIRNIASNPNAETETQSDMTCACNPGCTLVQYDGVSAQQRKELGKHYNNRGQSAEAQWHSMWTILFPGRRLPASIYVGNYVEEIQHLLRSVWEDRGAEIIARVTGVAAGSYQDPTPHSSFHLSGSGSSCTSRNSTMSELDLDFHHQITDSNTGTAAVTSSRLSRAVGLVLDCLAAESSSNAASSNNGPDSGTSPTYCNSVEEEGGEQEDDAFKAEEYSTAAVSNDSQSTLWNMGSEESQCLHELSAHTGEALLFPTGPPAEPEINLDELYNIDSLFSWDSSDI